jgi:hypothetical protein
LRGNAIERMERNPIGRRALRAVTVGPCSAGPELRSALLRRMFLRPTWLWFASDAAELQMKRLRDHP